MFGWSISASAWRSASKRAITCLGVHAQLDDLERHAAAHRLLLLRHIDHAAAAFADFLQQFIVADDLAHGLVRNIRQLDLHRSFRSRRGFGQHTLGLFMRREQRFEPLAQRCVVTTFAIKPLRSLVRRLGQRQLKQKFFAIRIHGC